MENNYSITLKEETKRIEDKYENEIYHLENKIINKYIETNIRKSIYLDF